jgi:GR25 family glycosyltransferase involved in LPS biosynthesis
MKHLDYFDGAFYINLDKRIDRRESFEIKSQEAGLSIPRFSALSFSPDEVVKNRQDPNWHKKVSCTASHLKCIEMAKDNGWESVLIFEDDAIFDEDFIAKAQDCINDLKNLKWNIFFFGGEPNAVCEPITENIVKTSGVYGAHAYAVHASFYNTILSYDPSRGLIDMFYINTPVSHKKFFLSRKLLVWQDDDRYPSDLWVKSNSEKIYRNAYKQYVK